MAASEAVQAAARAAQQMTEALQKGGNALLHLSDAVDAAQKLDRTGRGQLSEALDILGSEDGLFDSMVDTDEEEDAIWRAGDGGHRRCREDALRGTVRRRRGPRGRP